MPTRQIVLCHPVRTAIGGYGGSLKDTAATELGAVAVRETLRRAGLDASRLGSMTMGNVVQAGNRMNPARQAAVNGGVPISVPALTVNRVCGSGAQAITTSADEIRLGHHEVAVAGGMETMDRAPYPIGAPGAVLTTRLHHPMRRDGVRRGLVTLCIGGGQGIALAVEPA